MKRWLGVTLVVLFIAGCGTQAAPNSPQPASDVARSTTQSTQALQTQTSPSTITSNPTETITQTVKHLVGKQLVEVKVTNLNAGTLGVNVGYKYTEKNTDIITNGIVSMVKELAKTGLPIKSITITVYSPVVSTAQIGYLEMQGVDIKSLANADKQTILDKAQTRWVDLTRDE